MSGEKVMSSFLLIPIHRFLRHPYGTQLAAHGASVCLHTPAMPYLPGLGRIYGRFKLPFPVQLRPSFRHLQIPDPGPFFDARPGQVCGMGCNMRYVGPLDDILITSIYGFMFFLV